MAPTNSAIASALGQRPSAAGQGGPDLSHLFEMFQRLHTGDPQDQGFLQHLASIFGAAHQPMLPQFQNQPTAGGYAMPPNQWQMGSYRPPGPDPYQMGSYRAPGGGDDPMIEAFQRARMAGYSQ